MGFLFVTPLNPPFFLISWNQFPKSWQFRLTNCSFTLPKGVWFYFKTPPPPLTLEPVMCCRERERFRKRERERSATCYEGGEARTLHKQHDLILTSRMCRWRPWSQRLAFEAPSVYNFTILTKLSTIHNFNPYGKKLRYPLMRSTHKERSAKSCM